MKIPIATVKKWREEIRVERLVVFAVDDSGTQHVATHGNTPHDAREAARAGNCFKKIALGWPDELCNAKPVKRLCQNCSFYKPDYGIHCFNGWTGDGARGTCMYHAESRVPTGHEDTCGDFEPKD